MEPFKGYSFDLISNDPTGQAVKQIGLYGDKSPLNVYYCKMKCLQGYYYDFDSIRCRRCNYGCAICKRFDECDLCEAGFDKVKRSTHPIHKVENEMIGLFQLGCQHGFYRNPFDGECVECEGNCLKCIDSFFIMKERYDEKKHYSSFCLDCYQESSKRVLKNIINMTTGVCQSGCGEKVSNGSIIEGITREYCHVCGRGCEDCEIPETSNCLSCSANFYFQEETKKCLRLTETLGFWMAVISVSLLFLILFSLGMTILIYKMISGNVVVNDERGDNKNRAVLPSSPRSKE